MTTTTESATKNNVNDVPVWKFKDGTLKPVTELSAQELYNIYVKTKGDPKAKHSQGQPAIINQKYVSTTLAAIAQLFHQASERGEITDAMREAHKQEIANKTKN